MAEVQYRIQGKDNTKGATNSAVKSLEKLGKTAQSVGNIFKVALGAKIFKETYDAINKVTEAFGEQERAEIRLAAASRNNPLINGQATKSLKEYASALQRTSTFGDEAIIQQEAFLTTLNLSEDQIKDVMQAAVDLASTGMVSLESAVKNISKTYGGMTGELGELIPTLKNLTTEQLKSGEAVEFIKEQYKGMALAARNSVAGQKEAFKNLFGDFKEQIGSIFGAMQNALYEKLTPVLEGLIEWFEENGPKIYAIFTNIVPIMKLSFDLVVTIIKNAFNPSNYKETMAKLSEMFMVAFTTSIEMIPEVFMQAMEAIRDIITTVGPVLGRMFMKSIFTMKEGSGGAKLGEFLKKNLGSDFGFTEGGGLFGIGGKSSMADLTDELGSAFAEMGYRLAARGKQTVDYIGEKVRGSLAVYRDNINDVISLSSEEIAQYMVDLAALLEAGKIEFSQFKAQIDAITTGGGGTATTGGGTGTASTTSLYEEIRKGIEDQNKASAEAMSTYIRVNKELKVALQGGDYESIGYLTQMKDFLEEMLGLQKEQAETQKQTLEFVTMVSDYTSTFADAMASGGNGGPEISGATGGIFSGLLESLGPVVDMFLQMFGSLSSVQAILDPLSVVLGAMFDVIAPLLNEALKPIIGILVILGKTLGMILVPVFKALAPIIQWITDRFIWLYNKAIVPVGNFLYKLITVISTLIAAIIASIRNIGIAIWNLLHRKEKEKAYVDVPKVPSWSSIDSPFSAIDTADVYAAGDQYETGASGGAGASYTSGRNVTVNVQINTDVIVGDRREMAIWIAKEIHSAEELGLI